MEMFLLLILVGLQLYNIYKSEKKLTIKGINLIASYEKRFGVPRMKNPPPPPANKSNSEGLGDYEEGEFNFWDYESFINRHQKS